MNITEDGNRKQAYKEQKNRAKQRGIEFALTLAEFNDFWTPDRWSKRGTGADQLVMARHGDEGPYEVGNIKCITQRENGLETKRC